MSGMTGIDTLLTDHLDLWTSAIARKSSAGRGRSKKFSLHGIEKLRALILDLAVRGKLVSQDPEEEPASTLLKNLGFEAKTSLVSRPQGWEMAPLTAFGEFQGGITPSKGNKSYWGPGIPWVSPKDMSGDRIQETEDEVTELALQETSLKEIPPGSILMVARSGILRRRFPVAINEVVCTTNQDMKSLVLKPGVEPRYLQIMLIGHQPRILKELVKRGMTVESLIFAEFTKALWPIPPFAEQHRIVAKVDELMALCERLEAGTYEAIEAHQLLVTELLATLTASRDAGELAENWARIETHFDTLFVTEDSVDQLKQTILQLALRGVLTQQIELDEPATKLLDQLVKKKWSSQKGRKKGRRTNAISGSDHPFTLPESWTWCRFGDLVEFQSELVKPEEFQNLSQVAPDLIEKSTGRLLGRRTVAEAGIRGPNNRFYKGQILYSKIRPSLSKAIIAEFDGLCSADMYPMKSFVPSRYLLHVILSEDFVVQVRQAENRIKMPKLNVESLSDILVPLPPKEEQERIVATVDDLMARCDVLKSRISGAGDLQKQLADAIVSQAEAWDFRCA